MKLHLRKFLFAAIAIALATPAMANPNFIVIFIDDMGYADIGPFAPKPYPPPPPNPRRRAGGKFRHFLLTHAVSAPSGAGPVPYTYSTLPPTLLSHVPPPPVRLINN